MLNSSTVFAADLGASKDNVLAIKGGRIMGSVDELTQVQSFKGIPFAAPPLGDLRWRAPQAAPAWDGIKDTTSFANRCMQLPLYSDMLFRSAGISEDCLYLNVWTPSINNEKPLPVLLYFYGGGFHAGDGSEPRYDGASFAKKGVVTITANYRLGMFGLLAHPELSAETDYKGSGNYTFMDQAAALQWVVDNVAAFGGDPKRITIGGESAGSMSVSALMVSPLSKHNIAGAIGQSGSLLGPTLGVIPLQEAEEIGSNLSGALAKQQDKTQPLSIQDLRAMPAQDLLDLAKESGFEWFRPTVDGRVFPQSPYTLYQAKQHARVPLLLGNNSQEGSYEQIFRGKEVNQENYRQAIKEMYPEHFEEVSKLYTGETEKELKDAAQALAGDRFISFSTWNWADIVAKTYSKHVYFYEYSKVRPVSASLPKGTPSADRGAVHSAEIEYALGNLSVHPAYQWDSGDYKVSALMQNYFVNFVKTGNPNNINLPKWPSFTEERQLNITESPHPQIIKHLKMRYEFHRKYYQLQ